MHITLQLITELIGILHILGIVAAVDALYWTRTPQGAIAWGLSLITFPYLALPLYGVFGRRRFRGYRERVRRFTRAYSRDITKIQENFQQYIAPVSQLEHASERAYEAIAENQFTDGNSVSLLLNGQTTFSAIFEKLKNAKKYVLLEFFIIRNDDLGEQLQTLLMQKAGEGIAVFLLYDEIGCKDLPESYFETLRAAQVNVRPFYTRQGRQNFLQFNFRNHRKIVVVDGEHAFCGGHNVGNEYLGKDPDLGFWRDTHVQISGPAVIQLQATFLADWYWATSSLLPIEWHNVATEGSQSVLVVPTGPADARERCLLFFLQAINSAKKRLWIASPYFVPDESIIRALQLAALRGVDVRILLPEKPDHWFVWLASFSYLSEVSTFGVKISQYAHGFLHQKVFLVDDEISAIGTANLDNRSFRLNFEVTILVADRAFNEQVSEMFENDFEHSTRHNIPFESLPLKKRLLAKFARLFAPVL